MVAHPDLKAIGSHSNRDWIDSDMNACERCAGLCIENIDCVSRRVRDIDARVIWQYTYGIAVRA